MNGSCLGLKGLSTAGILFSTKKKEKAACRGSMCKPGVTLFGREGGAGEDLLIGSKRGSNLSITQ